MEQRVRLTVLFALVLVSQVALAQVTELRVLTEWAGGTVQGDTLQRFVDEFHELHPDIRVVLEVGGMNNLLVAYAGGVAPDVVIGRGRQASELGGPGGILLPLDSFMAGENGVPRDAFVPDLWSFSEVDGQVYQIAVDSNERGLFVNKVVAERVGIDTSQGIEDWNDLLDWARKLTIRSGDDVVSWGFNANGGVGGDRWHWIWLNDGEIFSEDGTKSLLDHPNTIEAVKFAYDLIHTYGVAPAPGAVGGHLDAFANGTFNMIITNSTFISRLDNEGQVEYVTFPGPRGVDKHGGRFSGATGSAFAILDTTKNPEAAWEFVKFMVYERGIEFAEARGGIPYLLEGLQADKYLSQPWSAFAESILTFKPRSHMYVRIEESRWNSVFGSAWHSALLGEVPAETAMIQAAETINAMLTEALAE